MEATFHGSSIAVTHLRGMKRPPSLWTSQHSAKFAKHRDLEENQTTNQNCKSFGVQLLCAVGKIPSYGHRYAAWRTMTEISETMLELGRDIMATTKN